VQQNFQLAEQGAAAQRRANQDILRGYVAQQDEAVKLRQLDPFAALSNTAAEASRLASENAAKLDELMGAARSVADMTKVYWEQWGEGIRAATEQQEILKKIAEETKAVTDKWTQPFVSALDNLGSTVTFLCERIGFRHQDLGGHPEKRLDLGAGRADKRDRLNLIETRGAGARRLSWRKPWRVSVQGSRHRFGHWAGPRNRRMVTGRCGWHLRLFSRRNCPCGVSRLAGVHAGRCWRLEPAQQLRH
jgi:hypothetical protein